ncbi:MAG: VCBS repeat-containing protein, partial [Myxococcota bacterium]
MTGHKDAPDRSLIASLGTLLAVLTVCGAAHAQSPEDVYCVHSGDGSPHEDTANSYGVMSHGGDLGRDGWAEVKMASDMAYGTPYVVDLGVWVDPQLVEDLPDAASRVLAYIDHLNCIYARGIGGLGQQNAPELEDPIHQISFRIHENKIRVLQTPIGDVPGENFADLSQFHWALADEAAELRNSPKLNVLFVTRPMRGVQLDNQDGEWSVALDADGDPVWVRTSASNGVGQGNAVVDVDAWLQPNRSYMDDWIGLIAGHELGHAMGAGFHLERRFAPMCCGGDAMYEPGEIGEIPSTAFSLTETTCNVIWENNLEQQDVYFDAFENMPHPVWNENRSYPAIYYFLQPYEKVHQGDVFLAYARGNQFLGHNWRVHDWFCINEESCQAGKIDGDGREDLIAFGQGSAGRVYLATSTPHGFEGTGRVVAEKFCLEGQECRVADVNGDGLDDLVAFYRNGAETGAVYVRENQGNSRFEPKKRWHAWFCINDEQCELADINNDGRADLVAF